MRLHILQQKIKLESNLHYFSEFQNHLISLVGNRNSSRRILGSDDFGFYETCSRLVWFENVTILYIQDVARIYDCFFSVCFRTIKTFERIRSLQHGYIALGIKRADYTGKFCTRLINYRPRIDYTKDVNFRLSVQTYGGRK